MSSFDHKERARVSFGYKESRINKGQGHGTVIADTDLDIAVPLTLSFTTPDDSNLFLRDFKIKARCTNPATLEILEAPTITVDTGSDVAPLNQNRNSPVTSKIESIKTTPVANQATKNATITADGTSLKGAIRFGIASQENEYITEVVIPKSDTTYSVRLTTTVDNSKGSLEIDWLEYVFG